MEKVAKKREREKKRNVNFLSFLSLVRGGNARRHLPTLTRLSSNAAITLLIHKTQLPTKVLDVEAARVVAEVRSVNAVVERERTACDEDDVRAREHHRVTLACALLDIFLANSTASKNVGVGATRAGDGRSPHEVTIAVGEDLSSPLLEERLSDTKGRELLLQHLSCGEHTFKMSDAVTKTLKLLFCLFVDWEGCHHVQDRQSAGSS